MRVSVQLWSYFKDLAGTNSVAVDIPEGGTVSDVLTAVYALHPKLGAMRNSTLIAVGVDYQGPSYRLGAGDEVSLFPPVQGG